MRTYHHDAAPLAFAGPAVNLLALGLAALVLAGVLTLGYHGLTATANVPILGAVVRGIGDTAAAALGAGIAALVAAAVVHRCQPASAVIRHKVLRALCHPRYGNPLRLREGELLPSVNCKDIGNGVYELTIVAKSCTVEAISDAASAISTAINGRYVRYAVTQSDTSVAHDNILKRIITMGASAGCYVIISIAEASVQEGGLPAMLRSAMSTRILFRPTRQEALLLWDKTKLDSMPDRVYSPGDAWFSSTDGVHDAVNYVHFPRMDFQVYRELGRLLTEYYNDDSISTPPAAE